MMVLAERKRHRVKTSSFSQIKKRGDKKTEEQLIFIFLLSSEVAFYLYKLRLQQSFSDDFSSTTDL